MWFINLYDYAGLINICGKLLLMIAHKTFGIVLARMKRSVSVGKGPSLHSFPTDIHLHEQRIIGTFFIYHNRKWD